MKERLQKILSASGVCSRRKGEELIAQGLVTVNGQKAQVGDSADPEKDIIAVRGKPLGQSPPGLYIMLHKPRGYVTTMSDELGRRCVAELVENAPQRVYPVGRLDTDSEGLILLTNDGNFANTIMHPSNHIPKTYRVTVRPDLTDDQAVKLSTGVMIDGKMTAPAQVHVVTKEPGRVVALITIYEGRNRQIRKMCEAVGLEGARLRRVSIGPIKLGMLQPGDYRELTPAELSAIRGYMNKAVNRRQNAEGEKAAAERNGRPAKKAPVKTAAKGRTPLGRR